MLFLDPTTVPAHVYFVIRKTQHLNEDVSLHMDGSAIYAKILSIKLTLHHAK